MFLITQVEDGLITVRSARTWTDVIPLLNVRRVVVLEDGKLILLVKRGKYACPDLPHRGPSGTDKQKEEVING